MRKVLYLLSELDEEQLDWLVDAGTREWLNPEQVLVREGQRISVLYLTLTGRFQVRTRERIVAELGAGEIIGELSFLDSRPPAATVTALENASVLSIPTVRLGSKLKTDHVFGSNFYRALGVMLAHRLRDTTLSLAYGSLERRMDSDVEEVGEFSPELLDSLNLAGARFESLMQKLDGEKARTVSSGT
jgi:CRP/FNR family cyclic AMP-dependent transcriptional regulator